jgi:putative hydrolase of the HAD superfamily
VRWKAVVFDLDDTLYPEADFVRSGFRAVSRLLENTHGFPATEVFSRLDSMFRRGVRGNTFDLLVRELGSTPIDIVPLIDEYRRHDPEIQPFADIPPLLLRLSQFVRLGLISDGYFDVQRRKLTALELGSVFESVVFTDEFGREHWKPHPFAFRTVLERLAVHPSQAVYVADNPMKDFLGARTVGMASIQCCYSDGDYCRLAHPSPAHAPDFVVDSVEALSDLLFSPPLDAEDPPEPPRPPKSLHE